MYDPCYDNKLIIATSDNYCIEFIVHKLVEMNVQLNLE